MSSGVAGARLKQERKNWRKDHPIVDSIRVSWATPCTSSGLGTAGVTVTRRRTITCHSGHEEPIQSTTIHTGQLGRTSPFHPKTGTEGPPKGWYARPAANADGSSSMMRWECAITGPAKTNWEGGLYKIVMEFSDEYPSKPPLCRFVPPLFHPNVYPSGRICLSIINEGQGWRPGITIKQMLVGIHDLLDSPNPDDPAQTCAHTLYVNRRDEYDRRVRQEAKKNTPTG